MVHQSGLPASPELAAGPDKFLKIKPTLPDVLAVVFQQEYDANPVLKAFKQGIKNVFVGKPANGNAYVALRFRKITAKVPGQVLEMGRFHWFGQVSCKYKTICIYSSKIFVYQC
jgi:hypothetical protein